MMILLKKIICVLICGLIFMPGLYAYEEKVEVIAKDGDVKVLPTGETEWITVRIGMTLKKGDRMKTGPVSSCGISFDDAKQNVVGVLENSDVIILLNGSEKIELIDADIYATLSAIPKGEAFEVRTPVAVCGARGTGLGAKGNKDGVEATAYKKGIYVKNNKGETKDIGEGFFRKIDRTGKISEQIEARIENIQKFQSWSKDTDKFSNLSQRSKRMGDRKIDNITKTTEKVVSKTSDMLEKTDDKTIDDRENKSADDSSNGGCGGSITSP